MKYFRTCFNQDKFKDRFMRRCAKFKHISKLIKSEFEEIITGDDYNKWDWLAFRLATYDDDTIFDRFEGLLATAETLPDYFEEISQAGWKEFQTFYARIFELQCFEYLRESGHNVSFKRKKKNEKHPDFILKACSNPKYIECTCINKTQTELQIVEEIIKIFGCKIEIHSILNIRRNNYKNSIASAIDALISLSHDDIYTSQNFADIMHQKTIYKNDDISIIMFGSGEFEPQENAHGDPQCTADTMLRELFTAKNTCNDLAVYRPNEIMVNTLNIDFQIAMPSICADTIDRHIHNLEADGIFIVSCGIVDKISNCSYVKICKQNECTIIDIHNITKRTPLF